MMFSNTKKWQVASSTGSHFDVLDGVRGFAMLMVATYHTFYINPDSSNSTKVAGAIIGTGWLGVPIFFVLSGFLISYPFFTRRAKHELAWCPEGYARRRIGKILPPFYLSIVFFTVFFFLLHRDPIYFATGLKWALGMPNFILTADQMNSPWWSLVVEAQFYVILPALFLLTRGIKVRQSAILIFATLFAVPLIARELTYPDGKPLYICHFVLHRFPCDLDFFAWGILFSGLFVAISPFREKWKGLAVAGYAGLVMLAITIAICAYWSHFFDVEKKPVRWSTESLHILTAVSAFLMLFFVFDGKCVGARILGHPLLRFIGVVSYEWYLFHKPVIDFWQEYVGNSNGSIVRYLLKTAFPLMVTFLFSVLVYRYFSLPLVKWIRERPQSKSSLPDQTQLPAVR